MYKSRRANILGLSPFPTCAACDEEANDTKMYRRLFVLELREMTRVLTRQ